jgi:hypothetical protein
MPVDLGGCSSFGATGPLEMALGLLSITALIAGPERAVLDASLRPPAEPALFGPGWRETVIARNRDYMKAIAFEDVSVTDDQGASYVLRTREKAGFPVSMLRPFRTAVDLVLELEPLPPPGRAWFEPRSQPARRSGCWQRTGPHRGPRARCRPPRRPSAWVVRRDRGRAAERRATAPA